MQSSLSRHLNKTFAMLWWRLRGDLNTDRRVLVEAELQKLESGRWSTPIEINMAFVFVQLGKHVSHMLTRIAWLEFAY